MSGPNTDEQSLARRIGERLRELRKARKLTLAAVAEQSGMSTSYLSAVEKGVNLPSLPVLARLTDALGVSIPSVLADEGRPHVELGRVPDAPGTAHVSHPLLQLDTALVRAGAGDGGDVPVHLEGRSLFVYVVSGTLTVTVGGEDHDLATGDALDIAAPDDVSWRSPGGSVTVWSSCPPTSSA